MSRSTATYVLIVSTLDDDDRYYYDGMPVIIRIAGIRKTGGGTG